LARITNKLLGWAFRDDTTDMLKIVDVAFGELADEYLLSETEAKAVADAFSGTADQKKFRDMHASDDRAAFAQEGGTGLGWDHAASVRYVAQQPLGERRHCHAMSRIAFDQIFHSPLCCLKTQRLSMRLLLKAGPEILRVSATTRAYAYM
jgi:hypothetical protein